VVADGPRPLHGALGPSDIGWARMIGSGVGTAPFVRWAHHLGDESFLIGGALDATVDFFGVTTADPVSHVDGPRYVAKLDSNARLLWMAQLGGPGDDAWLGAAALADGSVAVLGRNQKPGDQLQIIPAAGGPPLSVTLPLACDALADGSGGLLLAFGRFAAGDDIDPGTGVMAASGSGAFVLELSATTGVPRAIHLFAGASWGQAAGMRRDGGGGVVVAGPPPGQSGSAYLAGIDIVADAVLADYQVGDTFIDWALRGDGRAVLATVKTGDPGVCTIVDVDVRTGTTVASRESPGQLFAQGIADRGGQTLLWSNRSGPTQIPELGELLTSPGSVLPDWQWLLVATLQPFDVVFTDPDGTIFFFGSLSLDAGETTSGRLWPPASPFVASRTARHSYLARIGP